MRRGVRRMHLLAMLLDATAWFGSALVLVSLLQRDAIRLHGYNIVASVVFIVYDVALGLHPLTALNTVLALVSIVQIVRLSRRDERVAPVTDGPGGRAVGVASMPTTSTA